MAFSMLAAWIYCWHRLYTTVRNAVADYEEWIDLAFAKILTDAARYKDELVNILAMLVGAHHLSAMLLQAKICVKNRRMQCCYGENVNSNVASRR